MELDIEIKKGIIEDELRGVCQDIFRLICRGNAFRKLRDPQKPDEETPEEKKNSNQLANIEMIKAAYEEQLKELTRE